MKKSRSNFKKQIAACILFFEKPSQTIDCITSILPSNIKIYLFDNGSSLPTNIKVKNFCKHHHQIIFHQTRRNLGVAKGRNLLIKHSTEKWLIFLDNDIIIETKNWLEKLQLSISNHPQTEVFVPKLFNAYENSYCLHKTFKIKNKQVILAPVINNYANSYPGGASIINRSLFRRLGLYDNKMFVGFEDVELAIRGLANGKPIKARLINNMKLIHSHRPAHTKQDRKAVLSRYNPQKLIDSHRRITQKHNLTYRAGDINIWVKHQLQNYSIEKH